MRFGDFFFLCVWGGGGGGYLFFQLLSFCSTIQGLQQFSFEELPETNRHMSRIYLTPPTLDLKGLCHMREYY